MKERKLYECDVCHTSYSDKEECKKCEACHQTDLKIVDMRFTAYKDNRAGFPTRIEVVAPDGERAIYRR